MLNSFVTNDTRAMEIVQLLDVAREQRRARELQLRREVSGVDHAGNLIDVIHPMTAEYR